MPSLLQNKFVRYGLFAVGALVVIFIALIFIEVILGNALSDTRESAGLDSGYTMQAPSFSNSLSYDRGPMMDGDDMMLKEMESSYYPMPVPTPDGYTSELEAYETTAYSMSGRTKDLDPLCAALTTLKSDPDIHFKSLNTTTNSCQSTFYATESKVEMVLATLSEYRGVEVTRNTSSVTRHKQRLESQTQILQQQLARTERSLAAAEVQLERLNALFASSNDVTKLSAEVTNSLRYIDQLTERKINYNSRLNNLYQEAADLAERIDVVQFDVYVTRTNPITVGKYERMWENAWEDLRDAYHNTLIGLTAFFGIFLLWAVRLIVYILVLIVIIRGLWKFGQLLWRKW